MTILGLNDIDSLKLNINDYVIIGSAAAIAHGMPKTNSDLDVVIRDGISAYPVGILDICDHVLNGKISKTEIFRTSVVMAGYRYMGLLTLFKFYQILSQQTEKEKHVFAFHWLKAKTEK